MTKDTLEEKFDEIFDKHTAPTGGGYEADYTYRRGFYNEFEPVVLEYAKQESADFLYWVDGNGYQCDLHTDDNEKIWQSYNSKPYSTSELYNLYLQSKTK